MEPGSFGADAPSFWRNSLYYRCVENIKHTPIMPEEITILYMLEFIYMCACAARPMEKEPRVAFGRSVDNQQPYFALIMADILFTVFTCGGAVIAEGVIVTAAHCVVDDRRSPFPIITAKVATDAAINGTVSFRDARVIDIAIPNEFYPDIQPYADKFYGDIALVRIDPNATMESSIVSLPPAIPKRQNLTTDATTLLNEGDLLVASGMGLDETMNSSSVLEYVTVFYSETVPEYSKVVIERDHFIAIDQLEWQDTCIGDSGGPLVIPGKSWTDSDSLDFSGNFSSTDTDILVGIVSYGDSNLICGSNGTFGVYTSVQYWMPWIQDQLAAWNITTNSTTISKI